jgi:hypothetical protein
MSVICDSVKSAPSPNRKWQLNVFKAGVIACVAAYVGYIFAFGTNVIFWDEWGWTWAVKGHVNVLNLWSQDQSNIMFFPNLVALIVIRMSNWNDFAFFFLSAALMVAVLGLIVYVFWNDIKKAPLWWIPVPFVVLTLVQYQNTLWAFQICWSIVLFGMVGSIGLLTKPLPSTRRLVCASLLGILASYSCLQGLIVWPAGLLVLLAKSQSRKTAIVWAMTGTLTTVVYFVRFNFSTSGSASFQYILANLPTALRGLLITTGSIMPNIDSRIPVLDAHGITEAVGALLLVFGGLVIWQWFAEGRPAGPKAFCIALIFVTIVFDLLLVPSRLVFAADAGTTSRYSTFNWPLLLGIYAYTVMRGTSRFRWRSQFKRARLFLLLIICGQIVIASIVGIQQGQVTRKVRLTSADVLANAKSAPPSLSAPYLYPPCAFDGIDCIDLSDWILVVQQSHMNLFSDPKLVERFQSLGIVPGGVAGTQLPIPNPLRKVIHSDYLGNKAWAVLGAIYASTPGLQRTYPETAAGTVGLLNWAAVTGASVNRTELLDDAWYPPVSSSLFLQPYVAKYGAWCAILTEDSR